MRTTSSAICMLAALCGYSLGQTGISLGSSHSVASRVKDAGTSRLRPADDQPAGSAVPFSITTPTLGFVFDREASTLRRVPGIGGSASIGDPVGTGLALSNAYSAPQQDYAVGLSSDGQAVTLVFLTHGLLQGTTVLDTVPPAPDRVVFSPSGDSIALYYQAGRKVVALTGVPNSPRLLGSWDLAPYLGDLTSLAIKDTGDLLLAGVASGSTGGLMLLSSDGTSRLLFPMGRPTSAQFLWGRSDALVTDGAQGQVYQFSDVAGALNVQVLARPQDGLVAPDLLAVDRFAQTVLVAQRGSGSGLRINLPDGTSQPFYCRCAISGFEPLKGYSVYRITEARGGQFLLIDASGAVSFDVVKSQQAVQPSSACPATAGRVSPLTDTSGSLSARPGNCGYPSGFGGIQ